MINAPLHPAGVRFRNARLVDKADFDRVFAANQRARTSYLMVMARPNQVGYPRLGMVIGKRLLARAVDRNRVKRCVRENFRQAMPELPACDFVVRLIARPAPGDEVRDLLHTFARAGHRAMAKWPALASDEPPIASPAPHPNS